MQVSTHRYSLLQLRKLFQRGVLAVPEIQREFVWDAKKVCLLLDSLYRGYPIGSALVWKTTSKNKTQLREKLHILPPYNSQNREIWFIVDGQQRLSVLHNILAADGKTVANASGRQVAFDRFFWNATANEEADLFIYRQGSPPTGYLPLVDILGDRRRQPTSLGKRLARRMAECRERLFRAPFFLQVLSADRLEDVRETFIRINAQGTPVSSADKAFARASSLQVRHLARNLRSAIASSGFGEVPDETILAAVAFVFESTDIGGRAWERIVEKIESGQIARRDFDRRWRDIERALPYAVDYVRNHFGVANAGFLPSSQILTLLTLYFAEKGARRPSLRAAGLLRRWFWLASVSDRYSGRGYRQNLSADATFMRRLARKGGARLEGDVLVPMRDLRHAEYVAGASLSKAYFCLLNLTGPRYLEDGEPIPTHVYASSANRPDRHHIFPRQHLGRHGFGASEYNAIPNICFLVARENQSIGAKPPRKYMSEVPHSNRARRLALKSHLIPDGDGSGLWDRNARRGFELFADNRAALIADAFERQAGTTLFRRK